MGADSTGNNANNGGGRWSMRRCPHCLTKQSGENTCAACRREIQYRYGIPSLIEYNDNDRHKTQLHAFADTLQERNDEEGFRRAVSEMQDDYMDGEVTDRLFKTRTVSWRMLISSYLSGRGLVIGNHEPKVPLLMSELFEETITVDTSISRLRAVDAIAKFHEQNVTPIHAGIEELNLPGRSADVIVLACAADQLPEYLSGLSSLLKPDGTVVTLIDGWPRELGITNVLGLGETSDPGQIKTATTALESQISQVLEEAELQPREKYGLLSTSRHENVRAIGLDDPRPLQWLLEGESKAAATSEFTLVRKLAKIAQSLNLIQQGMPRYLHVSQPAGVKSAPTQRHRSSVLIAGKNRSTVLTLSGDEIETIDKMPNSQRQTAITQQSAEIMDKLQQLNLSEIPRGEIKKYPSGIGWQEVPVSGVPLDQQIEWNTASVMEHVDAVFDWLELFQKMTANGVVRKEPEEVQAMLTAEKFGLTDPPVPPTTLEYPLVTTHGDLFGSNIYFSNGGVSAVIDWEWAMEDANPIIDAGFFLLQLADWLADDFTTGIEMLFVEESQLSKHVEERIESYCTAVGIDSDTFWYYLGYPYISRATRDFAHNYRLDIDWPSRVSNIWDLDLVNT